MNVMPVVRTATKMVVGSCVSFTVTNAVLNNVSPKTKLQLGEVVIGSFVVGYMVADQAEQLVDRKIEEFRTAINDKKSTTTE